MGWVHGVYMGIMGVWAGCILIFIFSVNIYHSQTFFGISSLGVDEDARARPIMGYKKRLITLQKEG